MSMPPLPPLPGILSPGTYNGVNVTVDSGGVIRDANQNVVANMSSSGAVVPIGYGSAPVQTGYNSNAGSGGILSSIQNQYAATKAKVLGSTQNSMFTTGTGILGGYTLEDAVFIVLGILLIAAGAFGFKQAQSIVTNVASGAKKVAEVSA